MNSQMVEPSLHLECALAAENTRRAELELGTGAVIEACVRSSYQSTIKCV